MFYHSIAQRIKQHSLLRVALLSTTMFDEIVAGFSVVGLPLIRNQLHLSYTQIGLLLGIGGFSALLLEPVIDLLSDRTSRRHWILGGLAIVVASFVLAGSAGNFLLLLLAFALIDPSASTALGQSQAALIAHNPYESTRTMTHWTIAAGIGDLLSPLVVGMLVSFHQSYTTLFYLGALLWFLPAIVMYRQRFPAEANKQVEDNAAEVSLLAGFREALHHLQLLRWAMLTIIPTMMDEVLLGFQTLYLHDVLQVSQLAISLIVALAMGSALLMLVLLDRVLLHRFSARQLLIYSSVFCLAGVISFLTVRSLWLTIPAMLLINSTAMLWYPVAKGQAYMTFPERTGTVRAVISLLGIPFVFLPTLTGLLANQFGIITALAFLGTAPLLMLALVCKKERV